MSKGISGLYSGSFDPFTNGHLEVVKKAAKLFDRVVIGICQNADKKRHYDASNMAHAITLTLERLGLADKVYVQVYNDLTVREADYLGIDYLIRGIRNNIDYNYEENIASINEALGGIDTIYLRAGDKGNISSSLVRELLKYNSDISEFVPKEVLELINEKN